MTTNPERLTLPALPVRDMVLFPGARVPFVVGRPDSVATLERVKVGDVLALLTQRNPKEEAPSSEGLHPIGTLAQVESLIALPSSHFKVGVKGLARVRLESYHDDGDGLRAEVLRLVEPPSGSVPTELRTAVEALLARHPDISRTLTLDQVRELNLGEAIDAVAAQLPVSVAERQGILEQLDVPLRLQALLALLESEARRHAAEQTLGQSSAPDKDRPRAGRGEAPKKDEFAQLLDQILAAGMSEEAQKKALEELERLRAMPPQSAETTVSRTYLDWLLALPWQKRADERLDLDEAEQVLEADHAGLATVKTRILEYLAVMRRLKDGSGDALRGPILCLVGPPGVGKTSLARSIARALNRPFVRLSLGGLRDEAEIRGHRRTYIGAMPGRILALLKKAGVNNPLMLLDELDKLASDWRGDPASALLEVLDPEQNASFQDHYLDLGYDLSQVLFLCTANVRHAIPQALADRLEMIDLSGYTLNEKVAIAERHLVPKALESHGMTDLGLRFEGEALEAVIQTYTKEAGVRQLEREIGNVLRKLARHSLQPDKGDLA
ncbi:MAG: AAA family ATPase, partial [Firmicutes bacterium]|nr:AAA family ATPase [Bacillota bacterium]